MTPNGPSTLIYESFAFAFESRQASHGDAIHSDFQAESHLELVRHALGAFQAVLDVDNQRVHFSFSMRRDSIFDDLREGAQDLFAGVSVVLFTITPGSDIATDEDLAQGPRNFRVAPVVGSESFGFAGGFDF